MSEEIYLPSFAIFNPDGNVLIINHLPMFGVQASVPALFYVEDDALEVLYAVEDQQPTTGSRSIRRVGDDFYKMFKEGLGRALPCACRKEATNE